MHDIRAIRDNPSAFDAALARRGLGPVSAKILDVDAQNRANETQLQEFLAARKSGSKERPKSRIGEILGRIEDPNYPSKAKRLLDMLEGEPFPGGANDVVAKYQNLHLQTEAVRTELRALNDQVESTQETRQTLARINGKFDELELRDVIAVLTLRRAGFSKEIRSLLEVLPNVLDPLVPDGLDESANVVLAQYGEPRDLGFQPKPHWDLGEALGMMDFATAAKLAGARFTILRGPLARLERALG